MPLPAVQTQQKSCFTEPLAAFSPLLWTDAERRDQRTPARDRCYLDKPDVRTLESAYHRRRRGSKLCVPETAHTDLN